MSFAVLSKKVVLAFVRYKSRKELNANVALNDRMEIEITSFIDVAVDVAVDSDGNEVTKSQQATGKFTTMKEEFAVSGMLVANRTDVEADFVVMLKKRNASLYKAANKMKELRSWRDSTVSIVENRSLVKKQIEAVSTLCNAQSRHHRFHDILLGEDLGTKIPTHWLRDVVGDQQIIENALKVILDKTRRMGRPLNSGQESILRNVQFNYTDIIRGPPGCGKTTLIAAVAEFLVRCSDKIGLFLCAPSNGNTQRIHDAACEMFGSSPSIVTNATRAKHPQRVFRKHLEEDALLRAHDFLGKAEDDEEEEACAAPFVDHDADYGASTDAAWYGRMAEADKKREMDDPKLGITSYVVSEVMRNPRIVIVGNMGTDGCNVVPHFLDYLQRLKQKSFKKWKPDDKKAFKDAWLVLVKHFIGQKHVVCCTVGNTTSNLMSRALRKFKHAVIMIDEASLMTDPALWNAVANLISEMRIQNEFGGQSPIVKLMLIGDEAQGYPLVKSETKSCNYFGQQLARSPYERVVTGGGPVQEMTEQFRMVPALFEMPNRRWYGGKLYCSKERRNARLSADHKTTLEDFFGVQYPQTINDSEDPSAAQDNHLRLLLANVPNGQCQVEPYTLSRLNMGNVSIIIRIFRDLMYKNRKGLARGSSDVVILTFYNAQRRRLLNALLDLEKELGMNEGQLDGCLHTVDSYQGREARYVILDTTVCSYYGQGSLSHAVDERKACVAATRARDLMIVVGNLNILKANLKHEGRLPFIIDLLKTLRDRGAYKNSHTDVVPEKQIGAKLDSELMAEMIAAAKRGQGSAYDGTSGTHDEKEGGECTPGDVDDSSTTAVGEESEGETWTNKSWDELKEAVKAMKLPES